MTRADLSRAMHPGYERTIRRGPLLSFVLLFTLAIGGCSSNSPEAATTSLETLPPEETRVLADYVIAVVKSAGTEQAEALDLTMNATTPEGSAAALEAMADAINLQVERLGAIESIPQQAIGFHESLVATLVDFSAWYVEIADATRAGDQMRLQSLSFDVLDLQTRLATTAVEQGQLSRAAMASLPATELRSYLIEVTAAGDSLAAQLNDIMTDLQGSLAAGDIGGAIDTLEDEVRLLEDVVEAVQAADPPDQAQEYHDTYVRYTTGLLAALGDMLDAIKDEDLVAMQQASLQMNEAMADAGRLQELATDLTVEALQP